MKLISSYIRILFINFCAIAVLAAPALAAKDFNVKNSTQSFLFVNGTSGNIGIGTTTPQGGLVVTQGNVGIGTWAPRQNLEVLGTAVIGSYDGTVRGKLNVNQTTDTNAGGVGLVNSGLTGSARWWVDAAGNARLDSGLSANGNLFINGSGAGAGNIAIGTVTSIGGLSIMVPNVGIGTTAPQTALAVLGNVGLGTWTASTRLDTDGFRLSTSPAAGYVLVSGSTGIGTWMAPATIGAGATGWSTGSGTVYNTTGSDNVGLGTTTPQGALVIMNGNVGLGTLRPNTKLDIVGPSTVQLRLTDATADATNKNAYITQRHYTNAQSDVAIFVGTSSSSVTTNRYGGGSSVLNAATELQFYTAGNNTTLSGAQRMTIDSAGNVGIGTPTSIGGKLVVYGGNLGVGTLTPQTGLVVMGNVGLGTWTADDKLVVMGGNIGIGTFVPAAALQAVNVNNGGEIIGAIFSNASTSTLTASSIVLNTSTLTSSTTNNGTVKLQNLRQSDGSNDLNIFNAPGGAVAITAPTMTIKGASGNIGVGTITPGSKLTVIGGVGVGTGINSSYVVNAAPTGGMVVQGNVGIGTVAPQTGLAVMGNVGLGTWTASTRLDTDGFRLSTNPAAGYVMVSDATGIGTWMAAGTLPVSGGASGWSTGTGTVYNTTGSDNVGIGTSTPQGGLVVTNGNVGIGTWAPQASFQINKLTGSPFVVDGNGNVGIGTVAPASALVVMSGNLGIGTWVTPAGKVVIRSDAVAGGNNPAFMIHNGGSSSAGANVDIGFSISASTVTGSHASLRLQRTNYTNSGDMDWVFMPSVAFSQSEKMRLTSGGKLGIGTTIPGSTLSLSGNIGLGTVAYSPYVSSSAPLGGIIIEGNVGVGTTTPQTGLAVMGNVGLGTWTATTRLDTDGFRLSTSPAAGYVLVSGSTGIGTWMAASTLATSGGGTPGGSSSQLQYNNGGSFSGIVNSNVTATGNVGLGTSLSTNKLDVSGGVGIGSSYAGYYGGTGNGLIVQGNVGIGTYAPTKALDINGDIAASGSGDSYFLGNVGVGTSNPGTALDVSGTIRTTAFQLTTGAATSYVLQANAVGVGTWVPSTTLAVTTSSGWSTGTGTVYNTTGSNNVGIGTSTPQGGFVVTNGNVGIGTWAPDNPLFVSLPAVGANSYLKIFSRTGNTFGTYLGTTASNQYAWFTNLRYDGAAFVKDDATKGAWRMTQVVDTTDDLGLLSLEYAPVGNVNPQSILTLQGNGTNGNVGIGTTTPQAKLVVIGGNVGLGTWRATTRLDTDGFRLSTSPSSGYVLVSGSTGIGTWMAAGTLPISGGSSGWSTGSGTVYNTTGADKVGIGTSTPQDGLVVTNGNVGIGTWAPTSKLQINGQGGSTPALTINSGDLQLSGNFAMKVLTTQTGSANSGALYLQGSSTTVGDTVALAFGAGAYGEIAGIKAVVTTPSYGGLLFYTTDSAGTAERVRIDQSGNVGIGTTTPQAKLAVTTGNVGLGTWTATTRLDTDGFRLSTSPGAGYVLVSGSTGIGTWMAAGTLPISGGSSGWSTGTGTVYNTTGSDKIGIGTSTPQGGLVVTNGNVGIGTWAPSVNLEVKGRINSDELLVGSLNYIDSSGAAFYSPLYGLSNVGVGTTAPQGAFVVASGNVGIGTWTADYAKLVVRGNVGIGTTSLTSSDLNVYGNVGVGTAASFSNLKVNNLITMGSEYDNGTQGSGFTLDWNRGNKQKVTMSASYTITMTPPTSGVANLLLKVVQDGTGGWTPTLSGGSGVKWNGAAAPTFTAAAGSTDIVTCYYDGAYYWCTASLNFGP